MRCYCKKQVLLYAYGLEADALREQVEYSMAVKENDDCFCSGLDTRIILASLHSEMTFLSFISSIVAENMAPSPSKNALKFS
jgi:hypothetical protein